MINIGDIVEVIDENFRGKVVRITPENYFLSTEEGFEIAFEKTKVIKIKDEIAVSFSETRLSIIEKDTEKKRKKVPPRSKQGNFVCLETDLHIEQLTQNHKGMSNYQMLELQLETAKHKIDFAIQNGIQRLIFIHGVGEGVLRAELEFLVGRYEGISFQDADYSKYGQGAMELYIHQNPKK